MRLVIDSKGASGSLHLKISGFTIEFSAVSSNVTIEVLPVEEKLSIDKVSDILPDLLFQRLVALRKQIAR